MDNGAGYYRRFLAGDDDGLVKIVEEYKDGLILFINGFVKNVHIAEELTEDTFFRLMVKKPRFSGRSSFKSWLYAIGRHTAVDHIRRSAAHPVIPMEDTEAYAKEETDLERSFLREERRLTVSRAMDRLPTDYRQILWLVFFEDLSGEEAGRVMRKNSRQIRNLLYRAKKALKAELEKEGFVYEDD